jgi:transcriptional regulator with XRE-family HTH domain
MDLKKSIGERLRTLREEKKLAQVEIARILGKTQNAIFRYESGINEPSATVLLWYSDYFDVSLDYIFGRTDKKQGKLFKGQIKISNKEMKKFVEMAMTPGTLTYKKLMEDIVKELKGDKK